MTETDMVSVIIPTFNRFHFLLNTIKSIKDQTYKNIEIIVVNDGSTEKEYYQYNWSENNIIIINLQKNTKKTFGFICSAYVRNKGIEQSIGKYIAFCDDDDIWFPKKIELQLNAMKRYDCKMSSTDGLMGVGVYDSNKKYRKYNAEHYYQDLQEIYKGTSHINKGFPRLWNFYFLKVHNCVITSSVLIEKELLNKINNMPEIPNGNEDYLCWLKALEHTCCVYLEDPCIYYDSNHGYGYQ